jgi:hypothetical protein
MDYNYQDIINGIRSGEYRPLGFGSCRRVYNLNNGYVVKVARDIRGIEQNRAEYDIYKTSKSHFFAEITYISEDNRLLVMARAKRIKKLRTVYAHYKVNNINSLLKNESLYPDLKNSDLSSGDLGRASSWGIINRVPVLIDYGLTRSLFKKYYKGNLLFRKRYAPLVYE